jgi:hypothetical protein
MEEFREASGRVYKHLQTARAIVPHRCGLLHLQVYKKAYSNVHRRGNFLLMVAVKILV